MSLHDAYSPSYVGGCLGAEAASRIAGMGAFNRCALRFGEEMGVLSSVRVLSAVRRQLAIFVSLLLVVVSVSATASRSYAEEGAKETSRAIAIAYDNSGSMADDGSDKWCSAQYSLEVLAAMMGRDDALSLYAMDSRGEKLYVEGSQDASSRATMVHDADLGVSDWTDPAAAAEALEWLEGRSEDEKYLVITTDGDFNVGNELADVRETVNKAVDQGISVIYLAIGDEAEMIASGEGVHVMLAHGDGILEVMTEIANLIFDRAPLDESMYSLDGSIELQVPMAKLIVFAQGADVQLGDLMVDGTVYSPVSANVRYRDRMTSSENRFGGVNPNTSLQGVVATYVAPDGPIPLGVAQVAVSGADNMEVYYQVDVDIQVMLTSEDGAVSLYLNPDEQNMLEAGTYSISYDFLDPRTGQPLESSLLDTASFRLNVDDGHDYYGMEDGESITVEEGQNLTMSAEATTADGVRIKQSYGQITVPVPPEPLPPLVLSLSNDPSDPVNVRDLDALAPMVLTVAKEGGEPLTQEEWDNTTVNMDVPGMSTPEGFIGWLVGDDVGLDAEIVRGDEVGTWIVTLGAYQDDPAKTLAGAVDFDFVATMVSSEEGVEPSVGELSESVEIEGLSTGEYILNWLRTHIVQLIVLLLLLLALIIAIMEVRKPRFPRVNPKLDGMETSEGQPIGLRFSRNNIKHKFWPPWTPETCYFKVSARDGNDDVYRFRDRFELGRMKTVGLVAARTRKGKKGFRISDSSIEAMAKHDATQDYVHPSYAGEKQVFTPGSSFSFQGKRPHKKKGWSKPEEVTYRITF